MDTVTFATACKNLGSSANHADAESALISLRSSPHAIDTALGVLQTMNDELVTFHAALLFRDAALRQYQTIGLQSELGLMERSLDLALSRKVAGTGDALLQASAAIYKRCFLDMDDQNRAKYVQRAIERFGDKATEAHSLRLILHIIWEFSLTSQSTYLGQTMEFHSKCGKLFTKSFLKDIFVLVASALQRLQSSEACVTALDIIESILSWPFEVFSTGDSFGSSAASFLYSAPTDHRAGTLHLRNSARRICPDRKWAFLVQNDDLTRTLSSIYAQTPAESDIRTRIRQIFISLSCLSGDVFESDLVRLTHAKRLLEVGYGLCQSAFQNEREFRRSVDLEEHETTVGSECLAGCVIVSRSLTMTPPHLLLRDDSLLPGLSMLTIFLSEACRLCTVSYETTFLGEALRALTSVWVLFIAYVLNDQSSTSTDKEIPLPSPQVVQAMQTVSFKVFESLVQTRWQMAHLLTESAEVEEDDEAEGEEMSDLASIARANLPASLSHLTRMIKEFDLAAHDSPATRAERLGFLVRLTADVLADPDDGEIPIIPRRVLEFSRQVQPGNEDLVVVTSMALLELFQKETSRLELVSPLLSEHLMGAVRRWCASYLLPSPSLYADKGAFRGGFNGEDGDSQENNLLASSSYGSAKSLSPTLKNAFADPTKSLEILNFIIRNACVHLASFGSEPNVGTAAVLLIESCTKTKMYLKTSEAWKELCTAHATSLTTLTWDPLRNVSAEAHGDLSRVLASSFLTADDFDTICARPMRSRLEMLMNSNQSTRDQPQWALDCIRLCEIYRGVARSGMAGGDLSQRVRERIVQSLHDLVTLAESRRDAPGGEAILLAVLSVFADFCGAQLSFTESIMIPTVFGASKRLVDLYALVDSKIQQTRKTQGNAGGNQSNNKQKEGASEELEFRANSLNKVLKLLISLSERNSLDFSANSDVAPSPEEQDASGVVLACIDSVLPLFDTDLFQVSEVVESYFDLVAGMCRTRPEHVSSLAFPLFSALVTSLTFGCEHYDPKIQRWCLESIAALAKLHADSFGKSLARQLQQKPTLIFDFISKILELVVLSMDMGALDAAAGALLHLTRCDQQAFASAVEATIAKASNHRREGVLIEPAAENVRILTLVQVMRTQFEKLFEGVKIQNADRMDRRKFSSNLTAFVKEVRAYVLIK